MLSPPRILKRISRVLDGVHGAQGNFERPYDVISTRKGPSIFQVQEYLFCKCEIFFYAKKHCTKAA